MAENRLSACQRMNRQSALRRRLKIPYSFRQQHYRWHQFQQRNLFVSTTAKISLEPSNQPYLPPLMTVLFFHYPRHHHFHPFTGTAIGAPYVSPRGSPVPSLFPGFLPFTAPRTRDDSGACTVVRTLAIVGIRLLHSIGSVPRGCAGGEYARGLGAAAGYRCRVPYVNPGSGRCCHS